MDNLSYEKFETQSYLKNEEISKMEAQTYFKFRTRMDDFSDNFKNGATDLDYCLCSWKEGLQFTDSQQHITNNCQVVSDKMPEMLNIKGKDIYSTKSTNFKLIKILISAIETRKTLLLNLI